MSEFEPTLINFPFKPGQTTTRAELHKLVGGSHQTGMTSILKGQEFLLFHDAKVSQEFGYDTWEGWQADGSFAYTGQGKKGNQKLERGNKKLIEVHNQGLPIRLIESNKGVATYVGQFALGSPMFFEKESLDEEGKNRKVFVFNLIPVSRVDVDASQKESKSQKLLIESWTAPNEAPVVAKIETNEVLMEQIEHKLQKEFGKFMLNKGHQVEIIKFPVPNFNGYLIPDFWLPGLNLIVEAKVSSSRDFVRKAIGQILDYKNQAKIQGMDVIPAILLPGLPLDDLKDLILKLNIVLVYQGEGGEFLFECPKDVAINV